MATIKGITVARADEIEAASVVGGQISGKNLYLTTRGGAQINAGQVVPTIPPPINAWPVGSIFLTVSETNPATLLGGGTWTRWGQGRVPLSLDSDQVEFNAIEKLGGAKTHTLTNDEMPLHSHGVTDSQHGHDSNWVPAGGGNNGGWGLVSTNDLNVGFRGAVGVAGSGQRGTSSSGANISINNAGGNGSHNNMQPYIVCYMWKRTA